MKAEWWQNGRGFRVDIARDGKDDLRFVELGLNQERKPIFRISEMREGNWPSYRFPNVIEIAKFLVGVGNALRFAALKK